MGDGEWMIVVDVYSSLPDRAWRGISRLRTLVGLLKLKLCRLRAIASSRVNHYQIFCDSWTWTDDYVSSYIYIYRLVNPTKLSMRLYGQEKIRGHIRDGG